MHACGTLSSDQEETTAQFLYTATSDKYGLWSAWLVASLSVFTTVLSTKCTNVSLHYSKQKKHWTQKGSSDTTRSVDKRMCLPVCPLIYLKYWIITKELKRKQTNKLTDFNVKPLGTQYVLVPFSASVWVCHQPLTVSFKCSAFYWKMQISSLRKRSATSELLGNENRWEQQECLFPAQLTTSDSFILMVILLTASVALLIIFRKPAPLRAWVLTALGNWRQTDTYYNTANTRLHLENIVKLQIHKRDEVDVGIIHLSDGVPSIWTHFKMQ